MKIDWIYYWDFVQSFYMESYEMMSTHNPSNDNKEGNNETGKEENHQEEIRKIKTKAIENGTMQYNAAGIFEHALAPNNKKSNLNEKQWLEVRSANFKNWFGDWEYDSENASKIVDKNGEPLVVYHGGLKHEGVFYTPEKTKNLENIKRDTYTGKYGIYFSPSLDLAKGYIKAKIGGPLMRFIYKKEWNEHKEKSVVYPVFLNLRKPYDSKAGGSIFADSIGEKEFEKINKQSADGLIDTSSFSFGGTRQIIVLKPNQIKSAETNLGFFSTDSENINE